MTEVGARPDDKALAEPKRRLSICITAYKDLTSNTRVVRQAQALAQRGHKVSVVSFLPPDPKLAAQVADGAFLATGIPHAGTVLRRSLALAHRISGSSFPQPLHLLAAVGGSIGRLRCQQFARQAVALCRDRRFDVVQAHFDKALIASDAIRRQCGGRLVFDAVELPFDSDALPPGIEERVLRLAEIARERKIVRSASRWLSVSNALAQEIARRFAVPAPLVVRNCRDAPRQPDDRLRRDLGLGSDDRLVLALNSVRPGEGLEVVVDALRHLPDHVHLAVLGPGTDGPGGKQLRAAAIATGVAERLHFPRLQAASELIAYASGADLGVIPRLPVTANMALSLPNRCFEMIAAGLPLVVSRVDEIAGLVRQYRIGAVFREDDPRDAASGIRQSLDGATYGELKRRVLAAAAELSWEKEQIPYVEMIESLAVPA